ncbi:MAG: hypothetical protein U5L09_04070 [Bacteroidales bacterium]|nr:hypothetical protein [Bacteroidales bacterium]
MHSENQKQKEIVCAGACFFASWLGKLFQTTQKVPVFTAEHVKGILQDSRLDTKALQQDLDFNPTPLNEALQYSLDKIGTDWDKFIAPHPEKTIRID